MAEPRASISMLPGSGTYLFYVSERYALAVLRPLQERIRAAGGRVASIALGPMVAISAGLNGMRLPLPFALDHVNVWLLRDGDGWTLIDTGIDANHPLLAPYLVPGYDFLLEQAGLLVEVANHGGEAVEMVSETHYDAVLMDIQMPVMDGYTATEKLRKQEQLQHLPILAMTANATVEDRQAALDHLMNDHIPKPIDPDVLLNSIQSVFESKKLAPANG